MKILFYNFGAYEEPICHEMDLNPRLLLAFKGLLDNLRDYNYNGLPNYK